MSEDEKFSRRPMGMRMAMVLRQWRAVIDHAITDTGLTQSGWMVLMQLHQLGDNVSVSELADVVGIELPPLMRTLNHLETQGHLVRTVSPYDRRIRLLALTPQGQAMQQRLAQTIAALQSRIANNISAENLDVFSTTLNQIACNLRTLREEDNHNN
jgi:MarR family transcriptional regulator, transcriptional regulator for hemolysin